MQTFTFQITKPPFPNRGKMYVQIHSGTFEENRDSLSPDMMTATSVQVENYRAARKFAMKYAASFPLRPGESRPVLVNGLF